VGHVSITGAMARCRCGRIGCLEAVATSNAMLAAVGEPGLSFVDLAERARVEDGSARRAVDAALDQLAHAAAMVVGLLDPEVLVLTGFAVHYAEAGRHLERTLPGLLPPERVGRTEIRVSTLGPEAWVRGSVLVALQELQPSVGRLLRGV
jgi:predicted NBD/HSP70 family sugar kinase